jgi:hypothetical protein
VSNERVAAAKDEEEEKLGNRGHGNAVSHSLAMLCFPLTGNAVAAEICSELQLQNANLLI